MNSEKLLGSLLTLQVLAVVIVDYDDDTKFMYAHTRVCLCGCVHYSLIRVCIECEFDVFAS